VPASEHSLRLTDHYRARLAVIAGRAVGVARQSWSQMTSEDLDRAFERWLARVEPATRTAQQMSARTSIAYLTAFLSSELGHRVSVPRVDGLKYIGLSSDGRRLPDALLTALIGTKAAIGDGRNAPEALQIGLDRALRGVGLASWSAARRTLKDGMASDQRIIGWRRVARPGACGACLGSMTGRVQPTEHPIEIHPECQCIEEPVVGDVPDRIHRPTGPQLFEGLSSDEQDQRFGAEKAALIRSGEVALADLVATSPMQTEPDFITERPLDQLVGGRE
jgi:hypothetical protein